MTRSEVMRINTPSDSRRRPVSACELCVVFQDVYTVTVLCVNRQHIELN